MSDDAVFAAAAVERQQLADLVESLDPAALETPSLCAGWSVRMVAAHLASAVSPSKSAFVRAALRHRGNLHRANDTIARQLAAEPIEEIAQLLRENADSRFAPPVVGPRGPLTDALVHGGDIRVPLDLAHDPDGEHVRIAMDFIVDGRPVGFRPRGLLTGVQLVAADLGQSWGSGARVEGRGIDLLMAVCGREPLLSELQGPGVETLAARLRR